MTLMRSASGGGLGLSRWPPGSRNSRFPRWVFYLHRHSHDCSEVVPGFTRGSPPRLSRCTSRGTGVRCAPLGAAANPGHRAAAAPGLRDACAVPSGAHVIGAVPPVRFPNTAKRTRGAGIRPMTVRANRSGVRPARRNPRPGAEGQASPARGHTRSPRQLGIRSEPAGKSEVKAAEVRAAVSAGDPGGAVSTATLCSTIRRGDGTRVDATSERASRCDKGTVEDD